MHPIDQTIGALCLLHWTSSSSRMLFVQMNEFSNKETYHQIHTYPHFLTIQFFRMFGFQVWKLEWAYWFLFFSSLEEETYVVLPMPSNMVTHTFPHYKNVKVAYGITTANHPFWLFPNYSFNYHFPSSQSHD
mmetsp:Transcript_7646/g.10007  ORF Transcript_7646/g.10007 Transcript_7646/m.10007 type:complete len:132 (-) Transcript_7646:40-435(-)